MFITNRFGLLFKLVTIEAWYQSIDRHLILSDQVNSKWKLSGYKNEPYQIASSYTLRTMSIVYIKYSLNFL